MVVSKIVNFFVALSIIPILITFVLYTTIWPIPYGSDTTTTLQFIVLLLSNCFTIIVVSFLTMPWAIYLAWYRSYNQEKVNFKGNILSWLDPITKLVGLHIPMLGWNFLMPILTIYKLMNFKWLNPIPEYGWFFNYIIRFIKNIIFGHLQSDGIMYLSIFLTIVTTIMSLLNVTTTSKQLTDFKNFFGQFIDWIWSFFVGKTDIKYTTHVLLPKWLGGAKKYTKWFFWLSVVFTFFIAVSIANNKINIIDDLLNVGHFNLMNILIIIAVFGLGYWAYLYDIGLEWKGYDPDKSFKDTCDAISEEDRKDDKRNPKISFLHKFAYSSFFFYMFVIIIRLKWGTEFPNYISPLLSFFFSLLIFSIPYFLYLSRDWKHFCKKKKKKGETDLLAFSGGFSLWYIFTWGLGIFMRYLVRLLIYRDIPFTTIGILPTVNSLFRSIMLAFATLFGGIPYWLGDTQFAKI